MSKLQIIIGSTRPTRAADKVAPWVIERARSHPAFDVEVLDLRDWPLPIFAEHVGSIGDFNDPRSIFWMHTLYKFFEGRHPALRIEAIQAGMLLRRVTHLSRGDIACPTACVR